MKEKLFRDPVHNVIHFDSSSYVGKIMLELIDSKTFQRLRSIRQMGLANFVYPGAEHSRFGHSLGAMHVARRIYNACVGRSETSDDNDEEMTTLLLASLLHDIGHGPFSHAFESSTRSFANFNHEKMGGELILRPDSEINAILSRHDASLPERIHGCLSHKAPKWFDSIISGQLDADRMDYLLRDGLMTGVKNYMYDMDRIIEMTGRDQYGPVVHIRALQAVESYLLSRFHMFEQVYHHKAVRSAEKHIEMIFKRVCMLYASGNKAILDAGRLGQLLKELLDASEIDLRNYTHLTDSHVWVAIDTWACRDDKILSRLCNMLLRRDFLKPIALHADASTVLDNILPEIENLYKAHDVDFRYFFALDTAGRQAYEPYKMQSYPTLPFDGDKKVATSEYNQIRIEKTDGSIESVDRCSEIVFMLSAVKRHRMRCFTPSFLRDAVKSLLCRHSLCE